MIEYNVRRIGFNFKNILFSDPYDVPNCDQSQIISYKNMATDQVKLVSKTPIIRLNKPINNIYANFNKTTRNEINRSQSVKELLFEIDSKSYDDFYNLYLDFEKRKNRLSQIPKLNDLRNNSRLFIARYKGKCISAILCYDDQRMFRANIICSVRLQDDDKDLNKIISYSSRRLIYEICDFGIKNNYKFFDLGEICEDIYSDVYNITKFKLNFSNELVESIHYYKIYNPILKILALILNKKYF
ncbi:MAG: hypothetical protein UX41_C0011G0006 [Candidatus Collierbacteria bacterium GW2011_GWE1_46_18]|uniref:BioF2-like acetyltransferase domain-containing protein n=1 Tax=Candidatus Collierbacteria bacterium GW2011_GWE1_46_18 TaxID=1618399 RepID=A0A0G1PAF6_9BACT|nr:MAG: hypothetical protein UX41_C0011G0006 [Candidatus Collierbacteria bacterium GW2011_GWE1_46_18]HBD95955.1 hypothetical protein [Spirochaetia bacterium]